ncbi:MAG: uracil-DNA glycosylase [Armatimonadetes bacterium]|nr:uracil-DNA glycosylase [Armatimonadota bacterium]
MKQQSLKEEVRQFATQQDALFGAIIQEKKTRRAAAAQERSQDPTKPANTAGSRFAEHLALVNEDWVNAQSLDVMQQMISGCQKCPLGKTRNKLVFGTGNPHADIVVIGEAPGADEDASGEPFVGAAGQLLTKILAAINLGRDDVYIANIIKSRPPGNRRPELAEVVQCIPYLYKQLDLIKPKFILAVGLTAACSLLNRKATMKELRGSVHDYFGITMVVTYHPAALLRNPQWKRSTWEDVQLLRQLYDEWKTTEAADQ